MLLDFSISHRLHRTATQCWRDVSFNAPRMMILTLFGVFFGLVCLQVSEDDSAGDNNTVAAMMILCCIR